MEYVLTKNIERVVSINLSNNIVDLDNKSINDDLYGNIMVAVTESVNNAIIHGNGNDSKKNVKLKLVLGEKEKKLVGNTIFPKEKDLSNK